MFNINKIVSMENELGRIISKAKKFSHLVFYGCGVSLSDTYDALLSVDLKPDFIADSNESKYGEFKGVKIGSIQTAIEMFGDDFSVLITSPHFSVEIREYLHKFLSDDRILEFSANLIKLSGDTYRGFLIENELRIKSFYDRLEDDFSRETLENVIKGRLTFKTDYFQEVYREDFYFPQDIFTLSEHETFFDVGAFTGDTLELFVTKSRGLYDHIVCFDPNKVTFTKLEETASKYKNVKLFNYGAFDKTVSLPIVGVRTIGGATVVDEFVDGAEFCELVRIDDVASDYPVTLIKMDIEGSELSALHGAEQIIRKYKPKLAISLYHKNSDIVDIPEYIHSLGLGYKFYVRHHMKSCCETVLYAI